MLALTSLGASAVAAQTFVPPAASTARPRAAPAAMQMPDESWTWEDECGIEQIGAPASREGGG